MKTEQMKFWDGEFGKSYTDRNTFTPEQWNNWYQENFGVSKDSLNVDFLGDLSKCKVSSKLDSSLAEITATFS